MVSQPTTPNPPPEEAVKVIGGVRLLRDLRASVVLGDVRIREPCTGYRV